MMMLIVILSLIIAVAALVVAIVAMVRTVDTDTVEKSVNNHVVVFYFVCNNTEYYSAVNHDSVVSVIDEQLKVSYRKPIPRKLKKPVKRLDIVSVAFDNAEEFKYYYFDDLILATDKWLDYEEETPVKENHKYYGYGDWISKTERHSCRHKGRPEQKPKYKTAKRRNASTRNLFY